MAQLIPIEEFNKMYEDLIQDRSYLKGIIDRGSFESWIQTTVMDDPALHLKTLKILKPKLIEYEFYEQIKPIDELIDKLTKEINENELQSKGS